MERERERERVTEGEKGFLTGTHIDKLYYDHE